MSLTNKEHYVIGLMSGTSLDGIDVAIVKLTDKNDIKLDLVHFQTFPYPEKVKEDIYALCNPKTSRVDRLSGMNMLLGELYADASLRAIEKAGLNPKDILLISSHGQTIYHQPTPAAVGGQHITSTLQIGDIAVVAERTGITTVGDFRTRDMAAGGQGAPLVPYADFLLFKKQEYGRVIVNIGGIANITVLPKAAQKSDVQAYDTGPGNMLIDYFVHLLTDGKRAYDKDGLIAAQGKVDEQWLKKLLSHEYFQADPPKSTGRELFGKEYARQLWKEADEQSIDPVDRIATITELTAVTLCEEINRHMNEAHIEEILISGGGRNNPTLMKRIKTHLNGVSIKGTDEYGMSADAKEAIIFALLGYQCLQKETNNLPSATGSSKPVVMGKVAW